MKKYKESFTDEELRKALFKNDAKAKEIIEDVDKWESLKKKISIFLEKAANMPVIGTVVDDIVTMVEVTDSYIKKEYTCIPWLSIITIVCVLLYIISPIDLIPDILPIIGYVDDVAIVLLALKLVGVDLNKYRAWQEGNRQAIIEKIQKAVGKEISNLLGNNLLGTLVLSNDTFQVIVVTNEKNNDEKPYDCTIEVLNIPVDILNDNGIKGEKEYLAFLNGVVDKADVNWSQAGKLAVIHEANFDRYEDYFSIVEKE